MIMPGKPSDTLDYAHGTTGTNRQRAVLPRAVVLASPVPIVGFFAIAFTSKIWSHWFHIEHIRIIGTVWLATAAFDIGCLVIFAFIRKRWDVWLCMLLHGLMLAFTVFTGLIAIPFFMGWGPPGPGSQGQQYIPFT
jgi:hypothetical protein